MNTQRTYAPAAMECGDCGEVVELEIPVDVTVAEGPGGWEVSAAVDDGLDWHQPVWDHALLKHGPKP